MLLKFTKYLECRDSIDKTKNIVRLYYEYGPSMIIIIFNIVETDINNLWDSRVFVYDLTGFKVHHPRPEIVRPKT